MHLAPGGTFATGTKMPESNCGGVVGRALAPGIRNAAGGMTRVVDEAERTLVRAFPPLGHGKISAVIYTCGESLVTGACILITFAQHHFCGLSTRD
ncbi:MAG: hypothetical protein NVSMB6_16960 [Burkholderiaceae bacterium]